MGINLKNTQIHLTGFSFLLGCAVCIYFFGLRPVLLSSEQLRQTSLESSQLGELVPRMEADIKTLSERVENTKQQLQSHYTITTIAGQPLIGTVSQVLARRDIELINLREEINKSEGDVTIALQLEGDYADIVHLLSDLRCLDRPARIASLNLAPLDPEATRCSARMSVKFSKSALGG